MSGSTIVASPIAGEVTINSEVLLAAMATMLAVGEIVGHEQFVDLQQMLWGEPDRLRAASFGFPLEDDHPVLLRLDELEKAKAAELHELIGEVVLVDRKSLERAEKAMEDVFLHMPEDEAA